MLSRCYSEECQAKHPTYIGCSVAQEWLTFSAFRAWVVTQPWGGKQLDKDIIVPGNKVYSPETCVFVTGALNTFLCDNGAARGEWPLGVDWHKQNGKFDSRCSNPFTGKREHLGYFDNPQAAHEAWRSRKHELACKYAEMQNDPRITQALRARFATPQTVKE